MEESQLGAIEWDIMGDTYNRSNGAWKRTLWYGGHKKVPSVIRAAPAFVGKGIAKAAAGAAIGGIAAGPAGAAAGAVCGPFIVGKLADELPDVLANAAGLAARGGDRGWQWLKKWNQSSEQAVVRAAKKELSALQTDALKVIDRNITKLLDAQKSARTAVEKFEEATRPRFSEVADEEKMKRAHEALRASYEVKYYLDKVTQLVSTLETAAGKVKKSLSGPRDGADAALQSLRASIMRAL